MKNNNAYSENVENKYVNNFPRILNSSINRIVLSYNDVAELLKARNATN